MASEVDIGYYASKENLEEGSSTGRRSCDAQFNLAGIMECGVSYNVKIVVTSDRRLSVMLLQLLLLLLPPPPLSLFNLKC
jgi:hypothetical protein